MKTGAAAAYIASNTQPYALTHADVHAGQWMTVRDIQEKMGYERPSPVRHKISALKDKFKTKTDGRRVFYFVTPNNYALLERRKPTNRNPNTAYERRDRLVTENLGYVDGIVNVFLLTLGVNAATRNMLKDDLRSEGLIGLMRAAEKYDPAREIPFQAFAYKRVIGSMHDYLRRNLPLSRATASQLAKIEKAKHSLEGRILRAPTDNEIAAESGISPGKMFDIKLRAQQQKIIRGCDSYDREIEDEKEIPAEFVGDGNPLEVILRNEGAAILHHAISGLNPRHRTFVNAYYFEGLTMKQAGKLLNVGESMGSQMNAADIAKLRETLEREDFSL